MAHITQCVKNYFDQHSDIGYIVEGGWSTWWDGHSITQNLPTLSGRVSNEPRGWRNAIVHLGSFGMTKKIDEVHHSNSVIQTVFHFGINGDQKARKLAQRIARVAVVHTSCYTTREKLMNAGVPEAMITVIPLGVDTRLFTPNEDALEAKKKLSLPTNRTIISSFQKDGAGWDEGSKPKMIKGPDIFCDVVERVARVHPIHVLLTGPSRGYVVDRLTKAGIPFTHRILNHYPDIVRYYRASDIYLLTSREEGGPKAFLEAWACKTPLVSTSVGMVADHARDGYEALCAAVEDRDTLTRYVSMLIEKPARAASLADAGFARVGSFDWRQIATRYEQELYAPFI